MSNAGNRVQALDSGAESDPVTLGVDPVIAEAMKRWRRCSEWEANARERFIDDVKYAEGDSDNGYQWPAAVKRNRDVDKRPCLTINIVRQHNKQITNDSLQNKASVKIRAVGGGASVASAQLFEALVRQIEYRSNAQSAYEHASKFQVQGGIGWWRLVTQYVSEESFDQEIKIKRVLDPLSVYMDPDCQEEDCSDAKFAFVFDLVPKDQFNEMYPEYKDVAGLQPLAVGAGDDDWITKDYVRVAEYFRKVADEDTLVSFIDPKDGLRKNLLKSKMPKEVWEELSSDPLTRKRAVKRERIEWKLIIGEEICDETEWLGSYIPLVRVLGEETIIEGILDRKGHTRAMKDSQRMFNYNASSQVEFVALQSKTPYIASAKAIEDYEVMWNTANQVNHSVLVYNHSDPDFPDKPVPPPVRQQPPTSAPGFAEGMDTAFNQMMMASGQWQNQMGMQGNERTGSAIKARQHQSDRSVFNFQNNYESALKYCGRQIIELIPKVYDTKRLMKLYAEDGEELDVEMDPQAPQAVQEYLDEAGRVVRRVLNPKIGQYEVQSDVGASYGTRRQETAEALTLVLTQAPNLVPLVGDLLLRSMDFKEAQEAAQRLKRMVPPQALGKGPTPQEQQLQQQLLASQSALAKALQELGKKDLKLVGKDQMRDIDVYEAYTKRVSALKELLPDDPVVLASLLRELGDDALGASLRPIIEANAKSLREQAGEEPEDQGPVAAAPALPAASIPGAL